MAKKPAKSTKKPFGGAATTFPFLGQGDAQYYEWFEMWIWFAEPVPVAKRKALLKDAPKLCKRDAQWPDASLLWASTGDQWIHQHLIDTYGSTKAKARYKKALKAQAAAEDSFDEDDDMDYLDDLLASDGEEKKFNAEIETWLKAMHAKHPILFAARRQDGEAGGTKLGKWHTARRDADRRMQCLRRRCRMPGPDRPGLEHRLDRRSTDQCRHRACVARPDGNSEQRTYPGLRVHGGEHACRDPRGVGEVERTQTSACCTTQKG